jgi:hypothetical protein
MVRDKSRSEDNSMRDLEEVVKRKYLLIDTWDVRHQHLLFIGFGVLMFILYAAFMLLLCSMTPSLMSSLLLLGSQIGLGLPATRAFYDFGVSSRELLKFYDAGILGDELVTEDLRIKIGELPLVFEQLDIQIRKYDASVLDDINDLVWFALVVWAMVSSAGIFSIITGFPLCIYGSLVLILLCLISYISGYRTNRGSSFEEDLDHLEYYVTRCIKLVDEILHDNNGMLILQVTKRGRRWVLIDIIVEFKITKNTVIEYHLGLSSQEQERFIIATSPESLDLLYTKIKKLKQIRDTEWTIEQITTQSGRILRIVNEESTLCISKPNSYVILPEDVEKNIAPTVEILSDISSILNKSLDDSIEKAT